MKPPSNDTKTVNARELAAMLGVSRLTVLRWGRDGLIPSMKVGRLVMFEPEKVKSAVQRFKPKTV